MDPLCWLHTRMIYKQIDRNYLFDLNASLMIDGFSRANTARFINHPDEKLGQTANCKPKSEKVGDFFSLGHTHLLTAGPSAPLF